MNKREIKRELRRSATEDERPFFGVHSFAYVMAAGYAIDASGTYHSLAFKKPDMVRTFFLLVAEAL